jgi:hypothetical protein
MVGLERRRNQRLDAVFFWGVAFALVKKPAQGRLFSCRVRRHQ